MRSLQLLGFAGPRGSRAGYACAPLERTQADLVILRATARQRQFQAHATEPTSAFHPPVPVVSIWGSWGCEPPLGAIPGERREVRGRPDATERAWCHVDGQVLIERQARDDLQVHPLQLAVERASLGWLAGAARGDRENVEPRPDATEIPLGRELRVAGELRHHGEIVRAARDQRLDLAQGRHAHVGGDPDRRKMARDDLRGLYPRDRPLRDRDREDEAFGPALEDPEVARRVTGGREERARLLAVRPRRDTEIDRGPDRRHEIRTWYARAAGEHRVDQRLAVHGQLDGPADPLIPETRPEAECLDRLRRAVVGEEPGALGAVGEAVEDAREVGLEHGRRRDVDLRARERVERRAAVTAEADLDATESGATKDVFGEGRERHAVAGEPGRDGERPRVHRVARVRRAHVRGRTEEQVPGHDARGHGVSLPTLVGAVHDPNDALRDDLDAPDALRDEPLLAAGGRRPVRV